MKNLTISLLLVPALVSPGLALAHGKHNMYAGVKLSQRTMGFKDGYGNTLFQKNLPQLSVFGGYNINSWLGTELSVFTTKNKKKTATVLDGSTELGKFAFSGLGDDTYNTKTKLTGATLQLTTRYSLANNFKVFASAGLGMSRLKLNADMIINDGTAATTTEQNDNNIRQGKTKLYPVIGVGANWMVNCRWGVRADANWENTKSLKMNFSTPANGPLQAKAKNSFVYGLGVFYAF